MPKGDKKKKVEKEEAAPVGRPTKYKEEYIKLAYKCCLMGATDKELADFLEVNVDSIQEWKKLYPEFSDSIKRGKEMADARVVSSLYKRATGYKHKDTKIFQYEGSPVVVPFTAIVQPDTTAAIFWLKNRRPKHWRDKQEIDMSSSDGSMTPDTYIFNIQSTSPKKAK